MTHVPYSGAGPAVQAALSGTTHLAGINISAVMPHIKAGTLKALAQTGKVRWFELPDVPTLEDAGVPNSASETFQILLAPAGTPRDIVDKIAQAVIEILTRPEIKARLAATGFAVAARGPDALRQRIGEEVAMWREVIIQSKLKVQ
jgi:tripartite-type tricarboxylate transporter receptor subunit TctC